MKRDRYVACVVRYVVFKGELLWRACGRNGVADVLTQKSLPRSMELLLTHSTHFVAHPTCLRIIATGRLVSSCLLYVYPRTIEPEGGSSRCSEPDALSSRCIDPDRCVDPGHLRKSYWPILACPTTPLLGKLIYKLAPLGSSSIKNLLPTQYTPIHPPDTGFIYCLLV